MLRKKVSRIRVKFYFFFICTITPILICAGCSQFQAKKTFEEANDLFGHGKYQASLQKYEQILKKDPTMGDRVTFEMGIIHSHPNNGQKDYQKAIECFQKLIKDYPESWYRKDSEMMIFSINTVTAKDDIIAKQQALFATQQIKIDILQQEVKRKEIEILTQQQTKDNEILTLQKKIEALERKYFDFVLQKGSADRVLIEKKERRLTLFSKGEVLKTYKIALGGNPDGPKERQGDNKTPEGTYVIAFKNKDSKYHLSLHISYPNERDKKRAKELGVSPGGNIMIHGIKNGFSWVGDYHTGIDWTKGCIAVTDEEIEEIAKITPNGTTVEIRP